MSDPAYRSWASEKDMEKAKKKAEEKEIRKKEKEEIKAKEAEEKEDIKQTKSVIKE